MSIGIGAQGKWQFCYSNACVDGPKAVSNQWQFVSGTWDVYNQQIRIYVGDSTEPSAVAWSPPPGGTAARTAPLTLGAKIVAGAIGSRWEGLIAYPTVFPGVANKLQRQNLYYPLTDLDAVTVPALNKQLEDVLLRVTLRSYL
jgi:hypothetical protein